ncbi:nucleoside-diphosphate kinase [Streptomyces sp. VB1]|uniref:nucleoside-diphosphate kinase n=1 Tax=Streptomyces sp. VB1 TaxID=2986803 RepID=UPI0022422B48|nr:nucleoside-diphosphate kinase [Streptomyces sp. VB1]UZI32380.1 nucleoside-diphosphate kinase [Streptomyces sp. VB1]
MPPTPHQPDLPQISDFVLTTNTSKHERFLRDPYYREACEELVAIAGEQAPQVAARHALLLLKPDATVRGKLTAAIDWLLRRGWRVRASAPLRFNRWTVRGMWGYQWKSADRGRRDMADLYMTAADSLLLVLAAPSNAAADQWACNLLTRSKGTFDVATCPPGTLRHYLGSLNRQMNLVHTADEPADLLRELGVCLEPQTRREVFTALIEGRDGAAQAQATASRLQRDSQPVDLSLAACLETIRADLEDGSAPEPYRQRLRALIEQIAIDRSRDWQGVVNLAALAGLHLTNWQIVTLGTWLLPPTNGETPPTRSAARQGWIHDRHPQ